MIVSTFGILSSGVGTASAYSLDVVTLGVFGDIGKFLGKTAQKMVCLSTGAAELVILTEYKQIFDNKICYP